MAAIERTLTKDKAAQELIDWHFQVEPGLERVLRLISGNETSPDEPIKLLEVTTGTLPTGRVDAFVFAPAPDFPYSTWVAEITPEEYDRLRRDPAVWLPRYTLDGAMTFERPRAAA